MLGQIQLFTTMAKRSREYASSASTGDAKNTSCDSTSTGEAKGAPYDSDDGLEPPDCSSCKRLKTAEGTSASSVETKDKAIQEEEEGDDEEKKEIKVCYVMLCYVVLCHVRSYPSRLARHVLQKREEKDDDTRHKVTTGLCTEPFRPIQKRKRIILKEMYECWTTFCMYIDSLDYQSVIDLGRDYGVTNGLFWISANNLLQRHSVPDDNPYNSLYSMCKLFPGQFKYLVLLNAVKSAVNRYEGQKSADNEVNKAIPSMPSMRGKYGKYNPAGNNLVPPKVDPTIYSFPPPVFANLP